MNKRYVFGPIMLAIVCLLAAPSIAAHDAAQRGGFAGPHGGMWMLLVDNATKDNLQNMTLAQIDALKEQKTSELQNMTRSQIDELQKATLDETREKKRDCICGMGTGNMDQGRMEHGMMWMLLVDDATRDGLQNMTLAQIDALEEQKTSELQNMTLAQIDELREQKRQEMQNMTLAQIQEHRQPLGGTRGSFMGSDCAKGRHFGDRKAWLHDAGPRQ